MAKKIPWRWLIICIAVLGSLYLLYPTYRFYNLSAKEKAKLEPEKLAKLESKAIPLGLDLQGGTHLVLEVDLSKIPKAEANDAVTGALNVIESRVNQFGVTEPIIQRVGDRDIIIELPGLQDVGRASRLIGQTAQLEFKMLRDADELKLLLARIDAALVAKGKTFLQGITVTDTSKTAKKGGLFERTSAPTADTTDLDRPFTSLLMPFGDDIAVSVENSDNLARMLADTTVAKAIPSDGQIVWGRKPEGVGVRNVYPLYYVNSRPEMTGAVVADAKVEIGSGLDPKTTGKPIINFTTTDEGVRIFSRVTGANVGKRLAIILDSKVYSAPVIESKIREGRSIITGSKDMNEAKDLAIAIRTGALPAPVKIIEERTVGPSLGSDSIRVGVRASLMGLLTVLIFMFWRYRLMGLLANFAVLLNIILLMSIMGYFHATLTLPGIAGIILAVGMAVDANVLINERIREELRLGKSIRPAIDNGYKQAFRTIFDSNFTTLITSVVLYQFGTGPIKGFGLTLTIGLLCSMFTAVVVTRAILDFIVGRWNVQHLSIGSSDMFLGAKFKFIEFRRIAYLGSIGLIALGFIFLGAHRGIKYGIDFSGGTLLEVHFDPAVSVDKIRKALSDVRVGDKKIDLSKSEIKSVGSPNDILIRVSGAEKGSFLADAIKERIREVFPKNITPKESEWLRRQENVGPKIGGEMRWKAIKAMLISVFFIAIYVAWRFQFKYGIGTVVALVHDIFTTMAVLWVFNEDISMAVVAALLTMIGYSINDTIVVYDRIRERLRIFRRENYMEVIDRSINETLSRTTVTAVATLIVITALFVSGGEIIHGFTLTLLFGILTGTYSSIFIASPILVEWERFRAAKTEGKGVREKDRL